MTDQTTASAKFLDTFNAIDGLLRKRFDVGRNAGFYSVVNAAAESDKAIRSYATDLKEFADLRNAIVHESTDGRVIAEPHPTTVEKLQTILDRLSSPPKLGDLFPSSVVQADISEPVGKAARAMLEGNFSQLPIYEGEHFVELLTAETIARWLAHELEEIDLLQEAAIGEVIHFTEDSEHFLFLGRGATAYDALSAFDDFTSRGKFLDAILITNAGKQDETPLGIATVYDIPKLLDAVSISGGVRR